VESNFSRGKSNVFFFENFSTIAGRSSRESESESKRGRREPERIDSRERVREREREREREKESTQKGRNRSDHACGDTSLTLLQYRTAITAATTAVCIAI